MTSKTAQAKAIIAANANMARKDVLKELVAKAGLTVYGAATYYQKLKKLVSAPAAAPEAPAVVDQAAVVAAYEATVLEISKMTNAELVATFNANGGNVKRFADRQSGLKRVSALLTEKNIAFA